MSWLAGGIPLLTDAAFVVLTVLCGLRLLEELYNFPRRFGFGGIVIFGGILVWFCQDYLGNWIGNRSLVNSYVTYEVLAKATFFHMLFAMLMVCGLLLPWGKFVEKSINAIGKISTPQLILGLLLAMLGISFLAYFIFGSDSPGATFLKLITLRAPFEQRWTVGRTGNLNYSWGGYVAQLIELGMIASILGAAYTLLHRTPFLILLFFWFSWVHFFLYNFYTSRRAPVVGMVLPIVVLLFVKYNAGAAAQFRRISLKGFLAMGVGGALLFIAVQLQIAHRGTGFADFDFNRLEASKIQGNSMFSEALDAWATIPSKRPFFANRFPGEGAVRALPETAFWFAVGPIPRALWRDKPVDAAWASRAETDVSGRENQGTTVSSGLVGWWYFRFGAAGVVQGALLFGLLARIFERTLQNADGRFLVIMFSLAYLTELFRMYRDFVFIGVYPVMIAQALMWAGLRLFNR